MCKLFPILMFLSFLLDGGAQTWTSYLKPSKVNDFFEEEEQVWVATDGGIFKINLLDHTVEHWTKFSAGLPSDQVEKIARHPQTGQMFIGTYDVGIAFQTPGGWTTIPYPEELVQNQNTTLTYCFEWDVSGRLWVGTNKGLLRFEEDNWIVLGQDGPTQFLFQVWEMEKDLDGNVLAAGNVLAKIEGDSISVLTPVDFVDTESLFSYSSAHLYVQEDGVYWYFTDLGNVGRFEGDSLTIFSAFNSEENIAFNLTEFLAEDENGHLWAYLDGWGFYRYCNEWESISFEQNMDESDLLGLHFMDNIPLFIYAGEAQIGTSDQVQIPLGHYPFEGPLTNFQYDWEGSLWMKDGNHRLLQSDQEINFEIIYDGEPIPFSDYTIATDGTIWLVSGQNVYHQVGNGWERFNHTNANLPEAYGFRHIMAASNGHIWVQIYDKGIYYYNGEAWNHYFLPIPADNYVASMVAGNNGSIWFTSWDNYNGNKVVYVSPNAYKVYKDSDLGLAESNLVELFYERETDKLWLVSGDGQFLTFENGNWQASPLTESMPEWAYVSGFMVKNGLPVIHTGNNMALYQDEAWHIFDPSNSPIASDAIADTGLDQAGYLWIGHYGNRAAIEIYQAGLVSSTPNGAKNAIKMSISPNPAVDIINVRLPVNPIGQPVNLNIYQLSGQLIQNYNVDHLFPEEGLNIPIGHLNSGVYILEIETKDLKIGQPFIKK